MINTTISDEAPLIYYSYRQIITEDEGKREINAANKVSIRKHSDYATNGLEFLVYNCALSNEPELCNGIRQTFIVNDADKIDFEGKGVSGNGVPLNNIYGCFYNNKGMIELVTAKKNRKYIYHYQNCYSAEHPEIFLLDMAHIQEFFRSTLQNLQTMNMPYNPFNNVWYAIRAFVLSYYSRKWDWKQCPFPYVLDAEWSNRHQVSKVISKIAMLKDFERNMDAQFHEAYQYFRCGDTNMFHQKLDAMLNIQNIYYLIYSTLL